MTTLSEIKTAKATEETILPEWISVIFYPLNVYEADPNSAYETGKRVVKRPPLYQGFTVMEDPKGLVVGEGVSMVNFKVIPGSNLGIHEMDSSSDVETISFLSTSLWLAAMKQPLNESLLFPNDPLIKEENSKDENRSAKKSLLNLQTKKSLPNQLKRRYPRKSAIEVIIPEVSEVDDDEPRYRHFGDIDAIKLVKNHLHVSWIERGLVGESRSEVIKEATNRIKELIEIEKRMQSGDY